MSWETGQSVAELRLVRGGKERKEEAKVPSI